MSDMFLVLQREFKERVATKAFLLAFQGLLDVVRAPGSDVLGEKRPGEFNIVAVATQLRVED